MATQTCDRVITYRNFDYARAETIIQEEEYLDQEDFDDIRFYKRQGNILENIENAKEKYDRDSKDDFFATFKKDHQREKREDLSTNVVIPTYITDKLKLCYNTYKEDDTCKVCYKNCEAGSGYVCCSTVEWTYPCSEAERRFSGAGSDYNVFKETTGQTTSSISWPCIMVKIILVLSIKCVLMGEQCPLHPGRPPIDPPLVPRCPDDPNCPLFNNPNNVLDLVPPGLTPVATFPPFSRPRTVEAEAVIWREPPGTVPGERLPDDGRGGTEFRKKRHASYCPKKNFLEKFWLNIRCYKPRMEARLKQNSHGYGKRDTSYYGYNHVDHGYQDTCPGNCGTVEDCFDLPCPRYGARVRFRYTIPRNANLSQNYGQLTERQTGEGFRSRAPPDCRVVAG